MNCAPIIFRMGLKSILFRPVNLFRSRESRAASPHTSYWGLNRIISREPSLRAVVSNNIRERIESGKISLSELVAIAARSSPELRSVIGLRLIYVYELHSALVDILAPYLESETHEREYEPIGTEKRPYPGLGLGMRVETVVYKVTAVYTVRKWAQDTLKAIFALSNNTGLNCRIADLLNDAPPHKEIIDAVRAPAYKD